jgi:hypothetical protein
MNLLEHLKDKYGFDEPIFENEIQYENYTQEHISQELNKLVETEQIKLFETGIYYFPVKLPYGDSTLSPGKLIDRKFLTDGNNIYGYISGLSLKNLTGLSTQVPNLLELTTNNEVLEVNDIDIYNRRIRAHRSPTVINKDNVNTLQFLDLMSCIYSPLGEYEYNRLKKFAKNLKISYNQINKYVEFFPEQAIKNIKESRIKHVFTRK